MAQADLFISIFCLVYKWRMNLKIESKMRAIKMQPRILTHFRLCTP